MQIGFYNPHSHTHLQTKAVYNPIRSLTSSATINEKDLFVRSRKVSKPRDWYSKLSYRFEIWQAHRQHCCRSACQVSERSDNSKYKSRGFETLRDLTERRLFGYWDGVQISRKRVFSYYCTRLVHGECRFAVSGDRIISRTTNRVHLQGKSDAM